MNQLNTDILALKKQAEKLNILTETHETAIMAVLILNARVQMIEDRTAHTATGTTEGTTRVYRMWSEKALGET